MPIHDITAQNAAPFTKRFRDTYIAQPKGGSFDREIIDRILAQNDCQRLKYYFALDINSKMTIVLVGVDSSGNDIDGGVIAEMATPCPNVCGKNNLLNTD